MGDVIPILPCPQTESLYTFSDGGGSTTRECFWCHSSLGWALISKGASIRSWLWRTPGWLTRSEQDSEQLTAPLGEEVSAAVSRSVIRSLLPVQEWHSGLE